MPVSGVSINPECVSAYNELKLGRGGPKYVIYKISDDQKEIVVEEASTEKEYEVFRQKLLDAKDSNGKKSPRYAVYDVEFELKEGEGKRSKIVFIPFKTGDHGVKPRMIYSSSVETLKSALPGIATSIQATDEDAIEWTNVLDAASKGKGV